MQPEAMVNQWLSTIQLGGGETGRLGESGYAYFNVDGSFTVAVSVNAAHRCVSFASFLIPTPSPPRPEFLNYMLNMNLLMMSEHRAAFGLDDESGMVILCRMEKIDHLDEKSFGQVFSAFGDLARGTRSSLSELLAVKPPEPAAEAPADAGETWLRI